MAELMKAAVFEKPHVINVKEVPVPEITNDEVLIKVKYTGICGTDWSIYTGEYSSDKLPLIAGHEFSGVVERVGKRARGLKEGDRVTADINMSCGLCFYCKNGQSLMCKEFTQLGIHTDGTFAEYVKVPWGLVHVLPENIDFLKGAFVEPLSCVIHSTKAMNVAIGSSVAVIGTGLGILHGALAKQRGAAPVIVIGRNPKRLELAKEFGADYVINSNKVDDPVEEVRELTGGRGPDNVVEAVGTTKTYKMAFDMVRPGGTVTAFGITGEDETIPVRPFDFVLGEKKVTGSCAGVGYDWDDAIALLKHGRIKVQKLFSLIVPLEELEDALNQLRTDKNLIKVFVSSETTKRRDISV